MVEAPPLRAAHPFGFIRSPACRNIASHCRTISAHSPHKLSDGLMAASRTSRPS